MKTTIGGFDYEVEEEYAAFWKYVSQGKWEHHTYKILDYFLKEGDIVLDIGAWIGPITLYAARLASTVYALEPDPHAFPILQKNILLNPSIAAKIKALKVALCPQNGLLPLYARTAYGSSSSSLLARMQDTISHASVEGITFDELLDREEIKRIDFIKIDIEGGEFSLLPTMVSGLEKLHFPTLHISFHYTYIRESSYYQTIKNNLLSKIMMKAENMLSIDIFKKQHIALIRPALAALSAYRYVYTECGQSLTHSMLQDNPLLIKRNNLVFTNKKYK